jgi:membrane-bound PQQ-dependent dehydrogenase (glucose/quinate/shikimate family)
MATLMPVTGRRLLLGIVLAVICVILIGGGAQLLLLGGSPYYIVAGVMAGATAYFSFRGDGRGIWIYAALLVLTFVWALWESGGDIWGMQARVFAPFVLGVWVGWPVIRRAGAVPLAIAAAILLLVPAIIIGINSRPETIERPLLPPLAGAGEWHHYGRDEGGSRFSGLTQINGSNVGRLKQAWVYRTGVNRPEIGFEATPVMAGDSLYLCTSNNIIISLDAESGKQRWRFDPKVDAPPLGACRGVAYFEAAQGTAACARRIIFATTDARLMAVDAASGQPCADFGVKGVVDLKRGMGEIKRGYYYVSSAPALVRGKVVVGGWVLDNQEVGEPSGVIRAFDATSGQFSWAWDMDRLDDPNEPAPGKTYSRGTANSWAPISADDQLGLVYVPTGNATPDYWGGYRSKGSEKFSSAVVALDVETGRVRWVFQATHHDIWDYDVASQPTLIDLKVNGETVPALIQATKRAQIFLLDRRTGQPLAPVEERPVPQGAAAGDWVSPTQPFAKGAFSLDNTILNEKLMWGATPLDQLWCRIKFRQARYDGPMTPPGLKPSITYPSYSGGVDWGSVSVDPERQLFIVNWIRVANYTRLFTRADADKQGFKPSEDGHTSVDALLPQGGTPFAAHTAAFLSPLQIPCTQPPFGMIAAIDLKGHKLLWKKPFGTVADSGPFYTRSHLPIPMGIPNMGGSVVTRSGLVFIGATQERVIRALDSVSGKLLWSHRLPRSGHATPMTYISPKSGRQFVVIAAGGNAAMRSEQGDYVVAFALDQPRNGR